MLAFGLLGKVLANFLISKYLLTFSLKNPQQSLYRNVSYNFKETIGLKRKILGNKKKPFYERIWTKVIAIITALGLIIGVLTDGFEFVKSFKSPREIITNSPLIDIRVDPYEYNINDGDYKIGKTSFTIQTSKGSYQILDSLQFEKINIIKPEFFLNNRENPNSILTEVRLDYMIMDSRIPEQIGLLTFKNDFILKGEKLAELLSTKKKETIANIVFKIPYKFENRVYTATEYIPIKIYYGLKKQ